MNYQTLPGKTYPLGAKVERKGVNFCIYSKHAQGIELLLFDDVAQNPSQVIKLDPKINRTYHYWHIW